MKLPVTVLSLALALCSGVAAEEFTTSRGLRSLPPVSTLNGESEFKQATRAGETALAELSADAAAVDLETSLQVRDAAAFDKRQQGDLVKLDKLKAQLQQLDKQYLDALAVYKEKQVAYEADSLNLSQQGSALNSVPPEQREAAAARLKRWASESDARKASLDAEREVLLEQHKKVEAERTAVNKFETDAAAQLRSVRESLVARISARKARQESVYRQLRQCAAYVTRLREARRTKFPHPLERSTALESALERLKAYDARMSKKT